MSKLGYLKHIRPKNLIISGSTILVIAALFDKFNVNTVDELRTCTWTTQEKDDFYSSGRTHKRFKQRLMLYHLWDEWQQKFEPKIKDE